MRLTETTVVDYLRARGVLAPGAEATVEVLAGGVSSDVLAVSAGETDVVVKQSLERLRVAAEWHAPPERVLTEAAALRLAAGFVPDDVPPILDVDARHLALVMGRAPRELRVWKADLLAGRADPGLGQRVGLVLGRIHRGSAADPDRLAGFDRRVFEILRIDPYHRTAAARHPDVAAAVEQAVQVLLGEPVCLVHGDFSPKNILVDDDRISVLDWEVAHAGHPVFDVAFLISHLVLKGVHRPAAATAYRACAEEFLAGYRDAAGAVGAIAERGLGLQIACLLLARVDGKSPVEYLNEEQRERTRALARRLLARGDVQPGDVWSRFEDSHE